MAPGDVTVLLRLWRDGDQTAVTRLTPLVYEHLRRVAAAYLRNDQQKIDWQATELVDEVFLKLLNLRRVDLNDRRHFYIFAARVMRQILIDHARELKAAKRGAEIQHIPLNPELAWTGADNDPATLDLNSALTELERLDATKARVVELRFFFGLTADEAAEVLGVSKSTVDRDIRFSLTWLHAALHRDD